MPYGLQPFFEPLRDTHAQTAIWAVLFLILLDLGVGIVGAVMTKRFSSLKMREGLLHKLMELSALVLAVILDGALLGGLGVTNQPVLIATCCYVIVMELGSILELIKTYNPDAAGFVGFLTSFVAPKAPELVPAQNVVIESAATDPDATADLGRHMRGE